MCVSKLLEMCVCAGIMSARQVPNTTAEGRKTWWGQLTAGLPAITLSQTKNGNAASKSDSCRSGATFRRRLLASTGANPNPGPAALASLGPMQPGVCNE